MYSVVIPVLNEVDNLKELLPRLFNPGCEVIVCDNGSTDGTVRLVRDAIVTFNTRLSEGTGSVSDAILRGIRLASNGKIIVMDGDLSHPPEIVSRLVDALDEHDMVVASRYCKGGESKDTLLNKLVSRIGNLVVFGLARGLKDPMSGFFGIRKEFTGTIIRVGPKPMLELLVRAKPSSVAEIPYIFERRKFGTSKIGRKMTILETLLNVGLLYLHKYVRIVRYVVVGAVGSLIYMAFPLFFGEVLGLWYFWGILLGIAVACVWNFTMHGLWTFGEGSLNAVWNLGHKNEDGDFEWWEWYGPHPIKRFWKRKMGGFIKELAGSPNSVLSLGCGSSPVLNMFHCSVVGVDINKAKINFLSKHTKAELLLGDITGPVDFPSLKNGEYEVVLCNEVLEHLPLVGRLTVLVSIVKYLKSRGKAIISIPDYGIWWGRLFERIFHGKFHQELTVKQLDDLCEEVGLRKVNSRRFLWDTCVCYQKG